MAGRTLFLLAASAQVNTSDLREPRDEESQNFSWWRSLKGKHIEIEKSENCCSASFALRFDTRSRELRLLANVFDSSCHREDTTRDRDVDVAAEAEVARGELASLVARRVH